MQFQSFSQFFIPNGAGVLAPDALDTAAVHGEYACVRGCDIRRLLALVTEVTAQAVTSSVTTFYKRTAPGVVGGQVAIATITIGDGEPVGKVFANDIDPKLGSFAPGQALAFEITTAGSDGGGETGEVLYGFECNDKTEDHREEVNTELVTA